MSRRVVGLLVGLVIACGGGPGAASPDDKATTPEMAVRNFMQAVADSNITRMGRYWGTPKGPAALVGQPPDYLKRLEVVRGFLRTSPYRVVRTDSLTGQPGRQEVLVELTRSDADGVTCVRSVPFTTLDTGARGWIVVSLDLNKAGTPGRACKATG